MTSPILYLYPSQTPFALQCWDDVDDVKREVHVLETLRGHPHVVSIIETIEDEKEVHIIMELCEGGELFDRILERKYYGERQAAKVIRSVVEVLDYCHQRGIVHRDLKPENILLVSKRSDTRCKVIDFGMAFCLKPDERCKLRAGTPNYIAPEVIAKNYGAEADVWNAQLHRPRGERCKLRAGTPNYIAPEVIAKNYGAEADVWSAGVILYVLLCGLPPFWGDTTEDVFKSILWEELDFETEPWPVVSTAAKDLVRRMLTRKFDRRITVAEILSKSVGQRRMLTRKFDRRITVAEILSKSVLGVGAVCFCGGNLGLNWPGKPNQIEPNRSEPQRTCSRASCGEIREDENEAWWWQAPTNSLHPSPNPLLPPPTVEILREEHPWIKALT
ncbi:unnamed protein product [Closterium sp. Naga37s-1]|nr:unnamed protein product [Closterium sp. Naga37s-1]